METFELIKSRRTIQSFTNEMVSEEIIEKSIEAALWAPNHKLTLPWIFISVSPETRKKLAVEQVTQKEKKMSGPVSDVERNALIKKFLEPSHLIVAAIKKSSSPAQQEEDYASMACAVQNMALYLCSVGVGLKWGTGGLMTAALTYELLNLRQEEHKICGLIWVGKARTTPAPPHRPDVDEVYFTR